MNEESAWNRPITIGDVEHLAAITSGVTLAGVGLARRKGWLGWAMVIAGGLMIARGAQGYKRLYQAVGRDLPAKPSGLNHRSVRVEETVIVGVPARELYDFWHDFSNLPRVMRHLISVQNTGGNRSHWVAKAIAGSIIEWDAETINDIPGELIAWQSLEGSDIDSVGSVHFEALSDNETRMRVIFRYSPPADLLGQMVAKMMGHDPAKQVREDLAEFKDIFESGKRSLADSGF